MAKYANIIYAGRVVRGRSSFDSPTLKCLDKFSGSVLICPLRLHGNNDEVVRVVVIVVVDAPSIKSVCRIYGIREQSLLRNRERAAIRGVI